MKVSDHVGKLERLEATLARLDRDRDSEAIFEYAMIVGTHWVNAALHHVQLTTPQEDLLHSDNPPLWFSVPPELQPAFAGMKLIEDERNRFVRGPERCHATHSVWCIERLSEVTQAAKNVMARRDHDAD